MPDTSAAFRRNAPKFAEHLGSLLTETITDHPLTYRILQGEDGMQAFIRFKGQDRESRTITLGNGVRVYVFQRVLPNPKDPRKVTTAEYQYAYGYGAPMKERWIARWDYVPEEEGNPDYDYPVAHVHFNGSSESYDALDLEDKAPFHKLHCPTRRIAFEDFLEHLIVELKVPLSNYLKRDKRC